MRTRIDNTKGTFVYRDMQYAATIVKARSMIAILNKRTE
jgi:hypothetical protein